MIDYRAVEAKAHEWAQHQVKAPKHDPWIAAMSAGFGAGVVAILPLALAGVGETTSQFASGWTGIIVGAVVYFWFWNEKRAYEKVYQPLYETFLLEERARYAAARETSAT